MTTEEFEKKSEDTLGRIKVNVSKPDRTGKRNTSVEWTVKMKADDTKEEYEERYAYFKSKALREL